MDKTNLKIADIQSKFNDKFPDISAMDSILIVDFFCDIIVEHCQEHNTSDVSTHIT